MLKILWFVTVAFALSLSSIWLLDNNGQVVITGINYEIRTSLLAAAILTVFFALMVFAVSYLCARILAFRFPSFSKLFFKNSDLKKLERAARRSDKTLDLMPQLLMAIEVGDKKKSEKIQGRIAKLITKPQLTHFLLGKMAFDRKDYGKAEEFFAKIKESEHAEILLLKSKFELALEKQDDANAISYAKHILSIKPDDAKMAKTLLSLYKEKGLWQEAKMLMGQQNKKNLAKELQGRDITVMNAALAFKAYQDRKFSEAIKYAKLALKSDEDFLPATEILLRSWIKKGFYTKANWTIKKMWRKKPHLILAETNDLMYRKSSPKSRINAMKKLAATNKKTHLGDFAVGLVAFRLGSHDVAKEFLRLSLLKEKTQRAYKLLSCIEKIYGSLDGAQKYSQKAEAFSGDDHYSCANCGHSSSKWSAKCMDCGGRDSLGWHA